MLIRISYGVSVVACDVSGEARINVDALGKEIGSNW